MADITGTLTIKHAGRDYALRLTMRGLASLQAEFGNELGGLLDDSGGVPNFAVLLRVIEVALGSQEGAADLADEILTADMTVIERLMAASFPARVDGGAGNAKRAAKAKA